MAVVAGSVVDVEDVVCSTSVSLGGVVAVFVVGNIFVSSEFELVVEAVVHFEKSEFISGAVVVVGGVVVSAAVGHV